MPDFPLPVAAVPLSTVSLRLAGDVGQATLDWVAAAGARSTADLDQHVAAVTAALAGREHIDAPAARSAGISAASERRTGSATTSTEAQARAGSGAPGQTSTPALMAVGGGGLGFGALSCPDVPFVADALTAEDMLPLRLLLHYACGFIETIVGADWWPGESRFEEPDWESMRLAAVCHLVSRAEAAAELHPDLRPTA